MKSRGAAIDHAEVDLFPQPDQSGQDPLPVEFVCPSCREVLVVDREGWYCKREDLRFSPDGGIPSFLLPRRKEALQKFLDAYKQIRKTEGWGGPGSCEELPYRDRGGKHRWIWSIRARTFDCFLSHLSQRFPNGHARLLDLGAGNCWLALRMAEREFTVVALDINLDAYDGLGALSELPPSQRSGIELVQSEFDALPFARGTFDIAVFNASLHYSADPLRTISAAMGVLKDRGLLYVLDTPVYRSSDAGLAMVRERARSFQKTFNIVLPEEFRGSFLTSAMLSQIERTYPTEILVPAYGIRWALRPVVARLLGRRDPASFMIVALQKDGHP
jgi:SAM-dependent methyltransferase